MKIIKYKGFLTATLLLADETLTEGWRYFCESLEVALDRLGNFGTFLQVIIGY